MISASSTVPVYGIVDAYLGHGIVGGKLLNSQTHGKTAAEFALRILNGEKPFDIPVIIKSTNPYMLDYRQLDRWKISLNDLPKGAIVINKPFSIYEEYKRTIWSVAAVIVLLFILVAFLVGSVLRRRKAEKALCEREELLNKSQEMASMGSFVWDMRTNNITWSRNLYAIYGYDEGPFSGNLFEVSEKLIHPDDSDRAHRQVMEMVKESSAWDIEFRIIRPDGNERFIQSKGEVELDSEGNQVKSFGTNQDITELKKAEESLRKSEKQHRTILQTAIDGFMLIDKHGNITKVNDAYCEMSGYSRQELLKMNAGALDAVEPSEEVENKIQEIVEKKTFVLYAGIEEKTEAFSMWR